MTDPRFIFSINSGRAGSQYLARVLNTGRRVRAFHEAEPQMIGRYLRMIDDQPYEQTFAKRRFKVDAVRAHFRPTDPTTRLYWRKRLAPWTFPNVYADTSHMFIKTFSDVIMAELDEVDVIILRRPIADVVRSFVELGYFADNPNWAGWMSSPNAVTAAVKAAAPDAELDHIDKCIAYVLDIECRAVRFRTAYPQARIHEIRLAELNSESAVQRLFDALRIEPTRATKNVVGRRLNQKLDMKKAMANSTSREYCESRIHAYLERAAQLGIEIPTSLEIS